jgi:hypothetical protein
MGRKEKVHETCSDCGSDLFKCRNGFCSKTGCQTVGCDNQTFEKFEECKHCGHTGFKPVFKTVDAENTGRRRRRSSTNWDLVFGAGAALFVVLVAANYFFSNFFLPANSNTGGRDSTYLPVIDAGETIAYINTSKGVCSCYDEGFKLAGRNSNVLSSQYSAGFVLCREIYEVDGGDAWTAGWNARLYGKAYEASCRSYKRRAG